MCHGRGAEGSIYFLDMTPGETVYPKRYVNLLCNLTATHVQKVNGTCR